MLGAVVLVGFIILLVGALPTWRHSRGWGYWPSITLSVLIFAVLVGVLVSKIRAVQASSAVLLPIPSLHARNQS